MQLMPAAAKKAAQQNRLTYRLNDLTAKPEYNMQLGMAALAEYLDKWGGSYVLAVASYNAGAGNVTRWIETYGDPRDPNVDPIDWIELIPFGETRNYVQRVLENIEVYRDRLGGSGKLTILADLHRPNLPRVIALKDQPAATPVSVEQSTPAFANPEIGQPVAVP
jgi:soluble lytic murein transglycosylase